MKRRIRRKPIYVSSVTKNKMSLIACMESTKINKERMVRLKDNMKNKWLKNAPSLLVYSDHILTQVLTFIMEILLRNHKTTPRENLTSMSNLKRWKYYMKITKKSSKMRKKTRKNNLFKRNLNSQDVLNNTVNRHLKRKDWRVWV